jgi:N-acetylmuramoyl-L-alanine amidase
MPVVYTPSPNFGPRKEGKKIKYLILHYTGSPSAFEALKLLQGADPGHQVSAHYLIDTDGTVMSLVPEEMRAWHAGKSCWEGEEDINSCSIGIELQNPGHEHGYAGFPPEQVKAAAELCRDIVTRRDILPHHVLAHSDIAPQRKADPGELFPWASLAQNHVGLWPAVKEKDELEAEEMLGDAEETKSLLVRYGYDSRVPFKALVTAFQRHFEPEVFDAPEKIGVPGLATVARLKALMRQKLAARRKIYS